MVTTLSLEYLSSLCLLPFPLFLPKFRSSFYITLNTERLTIESPVTTLPSPPSVFYTATTGHKISTPHLADRGFKPSAQNTGHSAISTWPYLLGFISLLPTTQIPCYTDLTHQTRCSPEMPCEAALTRFCIFSRTNEILWILISLKWYLSWYRTRSNYVGRQTQKFKRKDWKKKKTLLWVLWRWY